MTELDVGVMLGPCLLVVDREVVARYADAADDHNPIHFDDDAAARLGLPGAIAHGMISGALLGRLLAAELGEQWLWHGRLRLKFIRPVEVGSTVVASGRVASTDPLSVELRAETPSGALVITGSATLDPSPRRQ